MSRRHLINSSDVFVIKGFTVGNVKIFRTTRKYPKKISYSSWYIKLLILSSHEHRIPQVFLRTQLMQLWFTMNFFFAKFREKYFYKILHRFRIFFTLFILFIYIILTICYIKQILYNFNFKLKIEVHVFIF